MIRKSGLRIVFVVIVLVVLGAVFMTSFKEEFDRFNPFMTKEYVYVQINEPAQPEHGRFKYKLTGYNAEGKKKKISFTASIELKEGTLLKVLARGSYTEVWEKVEPDDIPKDIKW